MSCFFTDLDGPCRGLELKLHSYGMKMVLLNKINVNKNSSLYKIMREINC